MSPYRAPFWLPGGHAQTIYPFLLPRARVQFRRERVDTPDGDFWDFDWLDVQGAGSATPLVALLHGLEGSSASHYARALMVHLASAGWRGVVPHFRGCGGTPNLLPRAYHSGDHEDVGLLVDAIRARIPASPLYLVGVSLGGSALLNWLGRLGAAPRTHIAAAAAISAPLDLTAAGVAIGQGFNRVYSRNFLNTLVPKGLAMAQRFPGTLDADKVRTVRSMYEFDHHVTAPLHGFAGADDYWHRASSKPWLAHIGVPTLVLNARNDPFVPAASLPHASAVSSAVVLEQPATGGHAGFMTGPFPGRQEWLPRRLLQFFAQAN
ncbi:MAG: alpha/beta fold hydrolase [Pseudomonadota bacterium]|nr:alpha/beta fold hydrolase [Pseudomonadota bacterium]